MRGSKLSRAVQYFEEADYREARVAFILVKEIMDGRQKNASPAPVVKRRRSRKTLAAASVEPVEVAS